MVGTALLRATGKAVRVERAHSPSKTGVNALWAHPTKLERTSNPEPLGERAHVARVHRIKAAVGDRLLELGEVLAQGLRDALAREQAVDLPGGLGLVGLRGVAVGVNWVLG